MNVNITSEKQIKHDVNISVVVPVFNEAGAIASLHQEILSVLLTLTDTFEIIYIDDGSTDGTSQVLAALNQATVVSLNRNYGQATALDAGFRLAVGEYIISLDGDGQNDPHDIPLLLTTLETGGFDVVAGWRKVRQDSKHITILTRIGRLLRHFFIQDTVHDSGCTLRVYRQAAAKSLDIQGEMHRYILAILSWKGFRIGEVVVGDRARQHGVSKYGPSKAVRGFIDLVYIWFIHKYSQRPLHIFGYASLVTFLVGGVFLGYAVYQKIFLEVAINRSGHFLLGSFSLLASLLLFSFGIVIDLLLKIHLNNSPFERRYYTRTITRK